MVVEAENAERTRSCAYIKSDVFSKADQVKRHQTSSVEMCMLFAREQAVAVAEQGYETASLTARACVGGLGSPEAHSR